MHPITQNAVLSIRENKTIVQGVSLKAEIRQQGWKGGWHDMERAIHYS
jgi:hypothetical protein